MDHTVIHFEIPANDVEKLKKFYSGLFDWKIEKTPIMEYYGITTVPSDEKGNLLRPGVNGGMYKKEQPQQQPVNYINVESVDEYSKKVVALGGQIVAPKMEIPQMGWFALAKDPEGNVFGIFESVPLQA
ncbi:MAG: VOC family protein [Candidatus Bathyarchaeota archaeon]|nr:VOC family protein [Candidatus Bathyarchaeota archaeon]